jgi:cyclopropane fatty-acyl-phospholipid synthase-like methyltransferase
MLSFVKKKDYLKVWFKAFKLMNINIAHNAHIKKGLRENCKSYLKIVNTQISDTDAMFNNNIEHYFATGASALNCILSSLALVDLKPKTILDFGCGSGRVTRWLRAAYPNSDIHGYEITPKDLSFIKIHFNAIPHLSEINMDKLKSQHKYDLIWVGSVFTHLSSEKSIQLFEKLISWLNQDGILIFSTHGKFVLNNGGSNNCFYGVEPSKWADVANNYKNIGYGYADYQNYPDYGISVSSLDWWARYINKHKNIRINSMGEILWDDHHDIISVQKISDLNYNKPIK